MEPVHVTKENVAEIHDWLEGIDQYLAEQISELQDLSTTSTVVPGVTKNSALHTASSEGMASEDVTRQPEADITAKLGELVLESKSPSGRSAVSGPNLETAMKAAGSASPTSFASMPPEAREFPKSPSIEAPTPRSPVQTSLLGLVEESEHRLPALFEKHEQDTENQYEEAKQVPKSHHEQAIPDLDESAKKGTYQESKQSNPASAGTSDRILAEPADEDVQRSSASEASVDADLTTNDSVAQSQSLDTPVAIPQGLPTRESAAPLDAKQPSTTAQHDDSYQQSAEVLAQLGKLDRIKLITKAQRARLARRKRTFEYLKACQYSRIVSLQAEITMIQCKRAENEPAIRAKDRDINQHQSEIHLLKLGKRQDEMEIELKDLKIEDLEQELMCIAVEEVKDDDDASSIESVASTTFEEKAKKALNTIEELKELDDFEKKIAAQEAEVDSIDNETLKKLATTHLKTLKSELDFKRLLVLEEDDIRAIEGKGEDDTQKVDGDEGDRKLDDAAEVKPAASIPATQQQPMNVPEDSYQVLGRKRLRTD